MSWKWIHYYDVLRDTLDHERCICLNDNHDSCTHFESLLGDAYLFEVLSYILGTSSQRRGRKRRGEGGGGLFSCSMLNWK